MDAPTFSPKELDKLREHSIAIFREKVILDAQPPITEEQLGRVRSILDADIPPGLLELWETSFGGAIDYDLQLDFDGRQYSSSFVELFYIGSDHYHDLIGWMEHERDLIEEDDPTLPVIPFGGFEYLDRAYCVVEPDKYGSIYYWAQGLPPSWKMNLTEDSMVRVTSSLGKFFDLLSLDEDPFRESPVEFERGEELRGAVESLAEHDENLANKLKELIHSAVFDWRKVVSAPADEELSPNQDRALRLALRNVADNDDVQLLQEVITNGYPINLPIQDSSTLLPYCLLHGAHDVAQAALESEKELSLDPIIFAKKTPPPLLEALVAKGFSFDVEAPLSLAEGGDVESALYVASKAKRANADEWGDLKQKARERHWQRKSDAASVTGGTLSSTKSADDYKAEAASLNELHERLPRKKFLGIF